MSNPAEVPDGDKPSICRSTPPPTTTSDPGSPAWHVEQAHRADESPHSVAEISELLEAARTPTDPHDPDSGPR